MANNSALSRKYYNESSVRFIFLCSSVLAVLGCANNATAGRGISKHVLNQGELRSLFNGVYVTAVQQPGLIISEVPGEIFMSDGTYVRIPGRTRIYGRFYIQSSAVCVKGTGISPRCRKVMRMSDGTYTLIDVSNQSSAHVRIALYK